MPQITLILAYITCSVFRISPSTYEMDPISGASISLFCIMKEIKGQTASLFDLMLPYNLEKKFRLPL
jgi:hypothetical protein